MKFHRWIIFAEIGPQAIPYIIYLKNPNLDEISLCIQEQVYDKSWRRLNEKKRA